MAKDIRECLLEQARKFHQWQEITYPGKTTEEIGGEWEVDYPAWNDIFDAFCHVLTQMDAEMADSIVPFPVSWTVKMKKKQKETQDILSYHSQAAGCSDKARAKASGGRQPIEECGRTGL